MSNYKQIADSQWRFSSRLFNRFRYNIIVYGRKNKKPNDFWPDIKFLWPYQEARFHNNCRNITINGITYNTAAYPIATDSALYIAEIASLGIAGFVNANYIPSDLPNEITASFSSFAAVTSVSIENSNDGGATWQVITFTQTSANQPTPCV